MCVLCDRSYSKSNASTLLANLRVDVNKVKKVNVLSRSTEAKRVIGKKTKGIGYKLFKVRLRRDEGGTTGQA